MKVLFRGRYTRKQLIWAGIAAFLVLVIGAYTVAGNLEWFRYERDLAAHQYSKGNVVAALSTTSKDTARNRVLLKEAAAMLYEDESACTPVWWASWQTVFPSTMKLVEECKTTANKQAKLVQLLARVDQFIADEQQATAMIAPLKTSSKTLTDKTWTSVAASWQSVSVEIQKYKPSGDYQPVLKELSAKVAAVAKAWNALLAADKKEDKTAYINAYDTLDKAYADIEHVATTSDETLNKLLKGASSTAKAL